MTVNINNLVPSEFPVRSSRSAMSKISNLIFIGNDIHTSVYDKRDDFGFPIVNFPWLSGDVPRLPSYGIYISQLVRFARCCTSVFSAIYLSDTYVNILDEKVDLPHNYVDLSDNLVFQIMLESRREVDLLPTTAVNFSDKLVNKII